MRIIIGVPKTTSAETMLCVQKITDNCSPDSVVNPTAQAACACCWIPLHTSDFNLY